MIKFLSLIVLGLFALPHLAPAKTIDIDLESPAVIELHGPINWSLTNPIVERILANPSNVKRFTIVINSPGGEIYSGLHLINAMNMVKQRGIIFRCVSTFLAASMAYQVFSACDERIALQGTLLLFHPPRVTIGGGMFSSRVTLTPRLSAELANDLKRLENILVQDLLSWMPISKRLFFRHYHAETLWTARELSIALPNWVTIVDDIVGVNTLDMSKSNKTKPEGRYTYTWSGIGAAK